MTNWTTWALAASTFSLTACQGEPPKAGASTPTKTNTAIEGKLAQYTTVRLSSDLGKLTENERRMLPLLIDAAASMDAIPVDIVFDQGPGVLQ